jgi:hypothetical protein
MIVQMEKDDQRTKEGDTIRKWIRKGVKTNTISLTPTIVEKQKPLMNIILITVKVVQKSEQSLPTRSLIDP